MVMQPGCDAAKVVSAQYPLAVSKSPEEVPFLPKSVLAGTCESHQ